MTAALVLFGGRYLISARHWFTGPVREGSNTDLTEIERELAGDRSGDRTAN